MTQKIYRQEALDRLSSPDQFDQLMPLTGPRAWIALAGAGVVLAAAATWAIFGTIAVTVDGEGVFTRAGGVRTVTAADAGRVEAALVEPGQVVEAGQTLLRLARASHQDSNAGPLKVDSPFAGRVLAMSVREGDPVKKGAVLVTLEPLDVPLEAVLFVPASEDAYLLRSGKKVRVARGTGKGQKGGHVNGTVKSVSRYPADNETMLRVLQNDAWVDQIGRAGPCLQVVVTLDDGDRFVPRSDGPGALTLPELYSGAPCHAHIVVQEKRPISLVLPF
jgi:hypothetical protein